MGPAPIVTRVLAQIEELLDVQVPGLQVGADRPLALATLVDRHRGVVRYLEEGDHALALPVRALDVAAPRPHRRPVIADAAAPLRKESVVANRLEDIPQIVADGRQVAGRQLRVAGAGVEEGRRRGAEAERR